jgi:thiamine biosynthesis lipoprotein
MVAESLLSEGAARAMVNLGGDLRAAGSPDGKPWKVGIDNPFDPSGPSALQLALADRGLATTTSLVRRWSQGGEERHHLIDPRTGRPSEGRLAAVTVIAARGWQAEVLAKAAFLSPPDRALELLAGNDATGLLFDLGGRIHLAPGVEPYLTAPARKVAAISLKDRALGKARIRIPPGR